ncbi:MAG: biotin/lipoyl-binding protein [Chloracidobacterium sp.]|nr:biotin/lipoyl-binding protein [Chloracidobacterium sp.]
MKFIAETDGNKHDVEIVREDGRVIASVDGRQYDLEASEPEDGVFLLKNEGAIFEAFVSPQANPADPVLVRVRDSVHEVRIIDPKRLRGAKGDDADASGKAEIKTAMPGKVVRILVTKGAEVKKGDGVMVVEAMKMQNEMKSPKDGTVTDIRVNEGDTVGAGDILMVVE